VQFPIRISSQWLGRFLGRYASQHSRLGRVHFTRLDRHAHRRRTLTLRSLVAAALVLAGLGVCLIPGSAVEARAQRVAAKYPGKPAVHKSSRPQLTDSDGSQAGIASFLGNFTNIAEPPPTLFLLQRQPDCSLNFVTANENDNSSSSAIGFTISSNTPHYERVLHQLASLTTTDDTYPHGCEEKTTGISSRIGVYLGMPRQGIAVSAMVVPGADGNVVRTRIYSSGYTTVTQNLASSPANAAGLATADLNADGNGDLVVVNYSGFVWVMLGNADGTFQTAVSYPTAGNSSAAAVIDDVNGDGKLDVVVVSDTSQAGIAGNQMISVLLGNGDGTFQSAKSFTAPALPGYTNQAATPIVNLITADLRGIGKKDIICSSGLVLLGNGDGTFTAASTPAFPYAEDFLSAAGPNLASGDLNNDGKPDLAVNNSGVISSWIGKGDGTFTAGTRYASILDSGYLTITDLDGDGNNDIYNGLADGGIYSGDDDDASLAYALMGKGDGTFSGAPTIFGSYTGNNLGDVNGDGLPDIITNPPGPANSPGSTFTVELGTATGSFNPVSTITAPASFTLSGMTFTGANTAGVNTSAVGDINGDGKADLVFADNGLTTHNTMSPIPVYFQALSNGDGTFAAPVPYLFPQVAASGDFDVNLTVSGMAIAPLTASRHNDLVFVFSDQVGGTGVTNPYLQGFAVLPGNGDGTFKAPVITTTYDSATAPATLLPAQIVITADFNGDGNADLLVTAPSFSVAAGAGSQFELFLSNGDGTFKAPSIISTAANPDVNGSSFVPCAVADFNKDGKLDVTCLGETTAGQAQLAISLGNGDGTFAAPTILNVGGGDAIRSSGIGAADFDGDGNVDIALLDSEDLSGIYYGKGDGTFTSVPLNGNSNPKDLISLFAGGPTIAGDFNHDGKPDLLAGNVVLFNIYGSAPVTTAPAATTTALTASAATITVGGSVTFTATITGASGSTGTPTGTVTFLDGTTTLGTGPLNTSGVATYAAGTLATGAHSITAMYGGDTNFAASTSTAVTVTVQAVPASFTLSASPTSLSIKAGATGTTTVSVTPAGGFAQPVTFACAGLPSEATCTFAPATVTPGAGAVTTTLTVTTTAAQPAVQSRIRRAGMTGLLAVGSLLLLLMPGVNRVAGWSRWFVLLFAFAVAGALIGCGGGGNSGGGRTAPTNPGTPSGTTAVTVTATSGSINQTASLQLTVQ
jgi:hypothetical protein